MRIRPIALCLGLAVTPGLALTAHAQYDVTVLQGGYAHTPCNDTGQSVGASGGGYAVLWSASGKATVLQDAGGQGHSHPTPSTTPGRALEFPIPRGGYDAVLWSPSGKATVLQDAGGQGFSRSLRHQRRRAERRISYTAGGPRGGAVVAVGEGDGASGRGRPGRQRRRRHQRRRAERWIFQNRERRLRRGAVVAVGEGDGASGRGWPGREPSQAINDAGQSVGYSGGDAVLWSPSGKATVLQDAGGQGESYALAINDAGWSVGVFRNHERRLQLDSTRCCGRRRGRRRCFRTRAARATARSTPSTTPGGALDIPLPRRRLTRRCCGRRRGRRRTLAHCWGGRDRVGSTIRATYLGTRRRIWFLLTPDSATAFSAAAVPEPSTWAMLLAGFAGLGFAGYRRARAGHATHAA